MAYDERMLSSCMEAVSGLTDNGGCCSLATQRVTVHDFDEFSILDMLSPSRW